MSRHTKYRPEYDDQARRLTLMGSTIAELATFFEVGKTSVERWMEERPSFRAAIVGARDIADTKVVMSLRRRALGYSYTERETVTDDKGGTKVKVVEKRMHPDVVAQIFWLKNRQSEKWRDRRDVHVTGETLDFKDLTGTVTAEEESAA